MPREDMCTRSPSAWLSTFTPGTSFSASSAAIARGMLRNACSTTVVAPGFSANGTRSREAVTTIGGSVCLATGVVSDAPASVTEEVPVDAAGAAGAVSAARTASAGGGAALAGCSAEADTKSSVTAMSLLVMSQSPGVWTVVVSMIRVGDPPGTRKRAGHDGNQLET